MPGATTGDPTHDKGHVEKICGAKADQNSRDSLDQLEHLPQNQNLSVLLFCAFHQLSWHEQGAIPDHVSLEKINIRALANKSPVHERNISNQTPSASILACLEGLSRLLQLRIWLLTASQLWEAWEA